MKAEEQTVGCVLSGDCVVNLKEAERVADECNRKSVVFHIPSPINIALSLSGFPSAPTRHSPALSHKHSCPTINTLKQFFTQAAVSYQTHKCCCGGHNCSGLHLSTILLSVCMGEFCQVYLLFVDILKSPVLFGLCLTKGTH